MAAFLLANIVFKPAWAGVICVPGILMLMLSSCATNPPQADAVSSPGWQDEFDLPNRELSDSGESKYFILKPGFQMVLESQFEKLIITVLDETKVINGITTRVLEEREERNGELIEVSRNFFAIDMRSGDVFYFGEEVDMYSGGQLTSHSGAWLAYEDNDLPGLIMSGSPVVGMKYYQEIAPGVAQDRAEIISTSATFQTQAGDFKDCLITQESSKIQPLAIEYKTYCPGVGLVQDETLLLINYGYIE